MWVKKLDQRPTIFIIYAIHRAKEVKKEKEKEKIYIYLFIDIIYTIIV